MKTCPQCHTAYENDFVFCLSDGNELVDEIGEQETVVTTSPAAQPFSFGVPVNPPSYSAQPRYGGAPFQTPVAMPPVIVAPGNKKGPIFVLLAAVVLGAAIVAGAIIYTSRMSVGTPVYNTASVVNNKPPANKPTLPRNTPVQSTPSTSTLIGRKGRLTTNQRIRSDSHKNAEILGVHYAGARIEVLDEKTYSTEDGSIATWFRVRVLEDGCDREGVMGCGNDLNGVSGQAASEGWMNAKFISLD